MTPNTLARRLSLLALLLCTLHCSKNPQASRNSVDAGARDASASDGSVDGVTPELAAARKALRDSPTLAIWSIDVDGDEVEELVLTNVTDKADLDSPELTLLAASSPTPRAAIVLTGIVLKEGVDPLQLDWSTAERLVDFVTDTMREQVDGILEWAGKSPCEAGAATLGLAAALLAADGAAVVGGVTLLLRGVLRFSVHDPTASGIDIVRCRFDGQTPQGCVGIQFAELLGSLVNEENLFGAGFHCYNVLERPKEQRNGSRCHAGSSGDRVPVQLCDSNQDKTGCCNADYVYKKLLSNVWHQAPLPMTENPTPIGDGNFRLGAPSSTDANFSDVVAELTTDEVAEAAGRSKGICGAVLRGAFDLLTQSSNPITINTAERSRCATNHTGEFHMLQGWVEQCITESSDGVSSSIHGEGRGRLARFNERVGPYMLASAREIFQANVAKDLAKLADNQCCLGADIGHRDEDNNCVLEDSPAPSESRDAGPPDAHGDVRDGGASTDEKDGGTSEADASAGGSGGAGSEETVALSTGASIADPHLLTFDGLKYDMQAIGELALVRDSEDEFEVQIRTKKFTRYIPASVTVAVAAQVGGDRVGIYLDGTTRLNGTQFPLAGGANQLPDGGVLYFSGATWTLVWPDGSRLLVTTRGQYLDAQIGIPTSRLGGTIEGLLGNYDGDSANDLRARNGDEFAAPISFEDFYGAYAESWRVTDETSLFDYALDETTETFTDRSFPPGQATLDDLTEAERETAEQICQDAGVPEEWLDSCIFDVAASGDPSLADSFIAAPVPSASIEIKAPLVSSGISLADIVGGGDGSGNGANQGISVLTGAVTTTHTTHIACPVNTFTTATNPYVDGVFCPDGGPDGTDAIAIASTGLTLTGVPDWTPSANQSTTWDHLWNGPYSGLGTIPVGTLAAHANKGITFDLNAIRAAHRNRVVDRFAASMTFAPPADPNPSLRDVTFIVAVDGVERARYNSQHESLSVPVDIPLEEDEQFLTLITASDGDIASDHTLWLAPRLLFAGSAVVRQFHVSTESLATSEVDQQSFTADAAPDGVFNLVVQGPVEALALYTVNAAGQTSGVQQWDTLSSGLLPQATGVPSTDTTTTWLLGVAEDGAFLNASEGALIVDDDVHMLTLYAQDSGYFAPGNYFRLVATSPGGVIQLSPVLAY